MKKLGYLMLITIVTLMTVAADDCGMSPAIQNSDFRVQNRVVTTSLGSRLISPYAVTISGEHVQDSSNFSLPFPSGRNYSFEPVTTGTDGRYTVTNGRAPALWRFQLYSGFCAGQSGLFDVEHGKERDIDCVEVSGRMLPGIAAVPSAIDIASPPATVTINGQGMNCANGMPIVEYYDPNGTLAQQSQATTCAQDGSWVSGPTPDLSSCYTGTYTLTVRNTNGDAIGSAVVDVFSTPVCNATAEDIN